MNLRRCGVCGSEMKTRRGDKKAPRKPQMTRRLVFMTDTSEGVIRVMCRTKVIRITPRELGYHVTEFLYQAGILPLDARPEPDETEMA